MTFTELQTSVQNSNTACPECGKAGKLELQYNKSIKFDCGNCDFITSLRAKKSLNDRFKRFLEASGFSDNELGRITRELECLMHDYKLEKAPDGSKYPVFPEKELPALARPITSADNEFWNYLVGRGFKDPAKSGFMVAPEDTEHDMHRRVIFPWVDLQNRIVGWNSRHIDADGMPRYFSSRPNRAVFFTQEALQTGEYLFITEGEFDAMHLGGVACGGGDMHYTQAEQINAAVWRETKVIVPDNDAASSKLCNAAFRYGYRLAHVPDKFKDVGEACREMGAVDMVRYLTEQLRDVDKP